jgi:ribonuclease-3
LNSPEPAALGRLEERLGHRFRDRALIAEALTHPSVGGGQRRRRPRNYERLEFLGDRVLGLVIAEWLLERHADEPEGKLSPRLHSVVQRDALAEVARAVGLEAALVLSPGDEAMRGNATALADACEAVIGALYLEGGLEAVRRFVRPAWAPILERDARPPIDPKTVLQQWALARGLKLPRYIARASSGPAHRPTFVVRVEIEGQAPVEASGASKREAEREAAAAFLARVTT